MAEKPKIALLDPAAAANVAKHSTKVSALPLAEPAAQPQVEEARPAAKAAPTRKRLPKKADTEAQDRLYVYVPPALARAIRIHCAGEHLSQSEFAQPPSSGSCDVLA